MSSFYTYTMAESDLTRLSNQVKELLVQSMVSNEYLTEEQGAEITGFYAVVVSQKGWLGDTWDKIRGIKDKGMRINVMKCGYTNENKEEPDEEEE